MPGSVLVHVLVLSSLVRVQGVFCTSTEGVLYEYTAGFSWLGGFPFQGRGPGSTPVNRPWTHVRSNTCPWTHVRSGVVGRGAPVGERGQGEGWRCTERPMAGRVVVQNGATYLVPTRTRGRISSLASRLSRDLCALSLPTGIAFPPPFHALRGVVADLAREGDGTSLGVRFGRFRPRPDSDISAHVDLARSRIGNGTRETT